MIEIAGSGGEERSVEIGAQRTVPRDAAGPAAARDRPAARHADAAGDRPGALGPARQRRAAPATGCSSWSPRASPELEAPGPDAALRRRRRRRHRAHDQDPRRHAADPRPGRPARAHRRAGCARRPTSWPRSPSCPTSSRPSRPSSRRSCATCSRRSRAIVESSPYLPEELQLAIANIDDPERAEPSDRRLAAAEDRGEAGAARGGRRRPAPAAPGRHPRARARGHLDRLGDPDAGPVRDRQEPARVRPAPAAQGDPGGARRVRRVGRRGRRAARAARRDRAARGGPPPGRSRAQAPRGAAAAGRRTRRHPHVPGVDRDAAVGQVDRGQPRPRPRARGPRRGPLRHRAGQGPHPRVPGRAASSSPTLAAPSCASSGRPASARRRSGARSRARSGASSSASASAACATRPRSAATGAPTSARCRARSSARCATRGPTTRCS